MEISYRRILTARVAAYLFAEAIPDLVQVFDFQKGHGAPLLDPLLVEGMIVQREDGFNVLPLAFFGDDTRSTFVPWTGDEMMYGANPFGFG